MTNQQATLTQTIWVNFYLLEGWKTSMEIFHEAWAEEPQDPRCHNPSDPEELRDYLCGGGFGLMMLDMLEGNDFDEDEKTKNWDKELIREEMIRILDYMENHPATTLVAFGVGV